jgi:hypothetical protein
MDIKTVLFKKEKIFIKGIFPKNPEDITGIGANICGLDDNDGYVKISMETWKRIELFMKILSSVQISMDEEKLKSILEERYETRIGNQN